MKTTILASVLLIFLSASCKKDYTCRCIISDTSLTVGGTTMSNIDKSTKGDAQAECDKGDASITLDSLKLITECELL